VDLDEEAALETIHADDVRFTIERVAAMATVMALLFLTGIWVGLVFIRRWEVLWLAACRHSGKWPGKPPPEELRYWDVTSGGYALGIRERVGYRKKAGMDGHVITVIPQ
jgi:hypothetical protein